MALESASSISDLVATNPVAGDPVAQGDDHIRLLKTVMLADLVNAVTKAASGHIEFPSGVILNWGTANTNASGVASLTFEMAFPTAALHAFAAQGSGAYALSVASPTTTSVSATLYVSNTAAAAGSGLPVRFFAIGY